MNYLLDRKSFYKNREKKNEPQKFWLVVLVVILLLVIIFFFKSLAQVNLAIFGPVLKAQSAFVNRVDKSFGFFSGQKQLVLENEALKEKIKDLEARLIAIQLNQSELETLRAFYRRPSEQNSFIVGKVISSPKHLLSDVLIVDIGKSNQLTLGAKAKSGEILLGEVILLSDDFAKVKLYSSPESKLAVKIGESSIPAEIVGEGDGNFSTKLPRGTEIFKEDLVVLVSGELVGVVEEVEQTDEDPFQTVLIRVPTNLKQLSWLEFYD